MDCLSKTGAYITHNATWMASLVAIYKITQSFYTSVPQKDLYYLKCME